MALTRRSGTRFQTSIWPGFVDAMTGLLLVLMFLLTIFMVVQFVLRETISGQESELDALSAEVSALAQALGLEERRNRQLGARLGELDSTLTRTRSELDQAQTDLSGQAAIIATLTAQKDRQEQALNAAQTRITAFQAQVADLLADRAQALRDLAESTAGRNRLEQQQAALQSAHAALNRALAQSRSEIDAQAEAARLAAARREALQAMIADLRQQGAQAADRLTALQRQLSDAETARLTEAAAAQALRERLQDADAELTAMTLALEARRQAAEDTLTLLAAAEAARKTLDGELTDALARLEAAQTETSARDALVDQLTRVLNQMRQEQALQTKTVATLDSELRELRDSRAKTTSELQAQLSEARDEQARLQSELDATRADLQATRNSVQSSADARAAVEARLLQALEALERAEVAATGRDLLQARLAAALAARQEAEAQRSESLSLAEHRAALLAQAKTALSKEQAISAEARRQTALLNQQIAALRDQLAGLQALLDDYEERDAAAKIQLESLGADLNAALARAAAEERKRRLLEESERKRLEEDARRLAATARELQARTQDLQRYRSEFFGRLREVLGSREGVRIAGDRFVFSSEVLFAPGRAELSAAGRAEIAKVAAILHDIAADIPPELDWVIRVDGHTDNTPMPRSGRYRDNWELSQGRALSVVRYLIDTLGMPPQRLAANGYGQFQPVNPGNSPEARAQNRRIELKLTER